MTIIQWRSGTLSKWACWAHRWLLATGSATFSFHPTENEWRFRVKELWKSATLRPANWWDSHWRIATPSALSPLAPTEKALRRYATIMLRAFGIRRRVNQLRLG